MAVNQEPGGSQGDNPNADAWASLELDARLGEMEANPDRLNNFEGEHETGASTRTGEYMTLYSGKNGMYAAAPDGTPLNNAKRKEMARMMHDAEDLLTYEEDERYKDYIARERSKIGTVYKSRDDFHHKVVSRIKRLEENSKPSKESDDKIELGEVKIEGIKQLDQRFDEEKEKELGSVEKELANLQPALAEFYAKNRRLIVGKENRAKFEEKRGEYGRILDKYLRLKAGKICENGRQKLSGELQEKIDAKISEIGEKLTEFSKNETDGTKTQEEVDNEKARLAEEARAEIQAWYDERWKGLKTDVNAKFLEEFIAKETELEGETIKALDGYGKNSGFVVRNCRKFVSKVLNNKVLKITLAAAGLAGLAFTVGGIAAGAVTVSFAAPTVGSAAIGALKGAVSGGIMSRQDSKVSKVRGFASAEDMKSQLEKIDATEENPDVKSVTDWLIGEYGKANDKDRKGNRKRTAVAVGLGAAMGGLASGLQIGKNIQKTTYETKIVDHDPITYKPQYGAANVDVSPNHGYLQIFEQVGGNPSNKAQWDQAFKITEQVAQKYGVVSDMSKGVIAPKGMPEILPGKPSTWDSTSQQFLNDILDSWAANGLIPRTAIGGDPIYGLVPTGISQEFVKDSIKSFIVEHVPAVLTGALAGSIGNREKLTNTPPAGNSPEPSDAAPEGETTDSPESSDAAPDGETNSPEPAPTANPNQPSPTPESDTIAGGPLTDYDRVAIDYYSDLYSQTKESNPSKTEDEMRLAFIGALGQRLGYPGFEDISKANEALSNLTEEQRDRLEGIYRQVVRKAIEKTLQKNGFSPRMIEEYFANNPTT